MQLEEGQAGVGNTLFSTGEGGVEEPPLDWPHEVNRVYSRYVHSASCAALCIFNTNLLPVPNSSR